jgi:hypothetical protein
MLFLRYYLWIAPHLFLGAFLWLFLRRGLQKQLPFFFTYLLFEQASFLSSVISAVVVAGDPTHSTHLYRWTLVWFLGIVSLASFGVIYELANQMILPRSTLAQALRRVLRWSAAALVVLAAVAAAHLGITVEHAMNIFGVLDFSTSVLQVGLLLVLFLFSRVLRISWRSLPVGIAVGLGIMGCVELSTAPLLSIFTHSYVVIDVVRMAGFHVCVLVWLGYIIFPGREPKFEGKVLQESELESWDQELQRMVER